MAMSAKPVHWIILSDVMAVNAAKGLMSMSRLPPLMASDEWAVHMASGRRSTMHCWYCISSVVRAGSDVSGLISSKQL